MNLAKSICMRFYRMNKKYDKQCYLKSSKLENVSEGVYVPWYHN